MKNKVITYDINKEEITGEVLDKVLIPEERIKHKSRGTNAYDSCIVSMTKYLVRDLTTEGTLRLIYPTQIKKLLSND